MKVLRLKEIVRKVTLRGVNDIMFDRYAGDNKTELRPDQKLYLDKDGKTMVMPSLNIVSFLCAQNTPSAAKRFLDSRKYKAASQAILSYTVIEPFLIPFLRNGKPIKFGGFGADETDSESGCYVRRDVARLEKGIPNPKVRPVLPVPWSLQFSLRIVENSEVNEELIQNLVIRGGPAIGLGTFRGVYGKFLVDGWA